MVGPRDAAAAPAWLRSPQAIRGRAAMILTAGRADELAHFALHEDRLDGAADYVVVTTPHAPGGQKARSPRATVPVGYRVRHALEAHPL